MPRAFLFALLSACFVLGQDETPSLQTFIRRGSSRASIIGDYIYFDGGELAQEGFDEWRYNNPVNMTLSIDISSSWAVADVKIREIIRPDEMLPMVKQAIFTDEASKIFYIWGGHTSWMVPIEAPVLWHFEPDGNGSGTWSLDNRPGFDSTTLQEMERVEGGAYVSTPTGGFVVGGFSGKYTSLEPREDVAGYAAFNFTTGEWTRESSGPYTPTGTLYGATATFVPNFGPHGLVIVLGGMTRFVHENAEYVGFQTLHFFDPITREWYSQVTSGEAPSGRHYHCAAGVVGTNGTYDIFVYGGSNWNLNTDYSDLYVLSLPGFKWTRITGLKLYPRAEHVCTVIGKRQMLSWGGVDRNNEDHDGWIKKDPFPRGIGIFDMTAMEWKNEYDASAKEYEPNDKIQSWYNDGGMKTVEWSSSSVRQLFAPPEPDKGGGANDTTRDEGNDKNKNETEAGGEENTNNDNVSSPSKPPIGAIVGGVVGGVGALLILGIGIWLCRRRRRRSQSWMQPPMAKTGPMPRFELQYEPSGQISELHSHSIPTELSGDRGTTR